MRNARDDLLALLREHSYREGTFTLASGKQSDFYIDCKQTLLQRFGLWRAAQVVAGLIRQRETAEVIGVAGEGVGGAPLAAAVCMFTGFLDDDTLHPVIIRKAAKDHGTEQEVERSRAMVPDGSRVVLVEDVLTTGGSVARAAGALRRAGLEVQTVVALVDRCEGASKMLDEHAGLVVVPVFNRHDFIPK